LTAEERKDIVKTALRDLLCHDFWDTRLIAFGKLD